MIHSKPCLIETPKNDLADSACERRLGVVSGCCLLTDVECKEHEGITGRKKDSSTRSTCQWVQGDGNDHV